MRNDDVPSVGRVVIDPSAAQRLRRHALALVPASRRRFAHELVTYGRALAGTASRSGARVLIFAQGRTGSTLLESLLASTGLFKVNSEPLSGRTQIRHPSLYVRGLARHPDRQGKGGNFICHVKVYHLTVFRQRVGRQPVSPIRFLQDLDRDGWRFLYVRRENAIRQVVSQYVAEARGGYHKRDDALEATTVTIDRDDLRHRLVAWQRHTQQEQAALRHVDHLSVVYERDLLDPSIHQRTVDAALGYLGLEHHEPVATQLRKITTRHLHDVVDNYEQFETWVRELGFHAMLDAPTGRDGITG